MKERIMRLLQEPGFVSGQRISEELGISRTAVWKYINALKEDGYEIESVTRKGYRLVRSPDILTRERLARLLPKTAVSGEICCYDSIDSTNEEAKRHALSGAPDRSLYVAERQTRGKGRRGREWKSPAGKDLFFSVLLRPDIPMERASMITLISACAAVNTAEKYAGEKCFIKWPNDVVLRDKKICGILSEMSTEMDRILYVVVGVGMNLNRTEFEPEISQMAGSVLSETGHVVNRGEFLADYMQEFDRIYSVFLEKQSLAFLSDEYNARLINKGRTVKVSRPGQSGELVGRAAGINELGELLIEDPDGKLRSIRSGEVSVRGLYGYV